MASLKEETIDVEENEMKSNSTETFISSSPAAEITTPTSNFTVANDHGVPGPTTSALSGEASNDNNNNNEKKQHKEQIQNNDIPSTNKNGNEEKEATRKRLTPFPLDEQKIKLGVCAMASKANSKPMQEILTRLPSDQFEIIIFPEDMILNDPIDTWPICDCLIAFFSSGYPLEKVEKYVALRQCFSVNNLKNQHILKDRRKVYDRLKEFGVPVPNHLIVNRDPTYGPVNEIKEGDDWIEVDGKKMYKPFVEKPVDADDHNIYIYYPASSGGGSKRLFRKTEDRASNFVPDVDRVRRDGSYVYEEFLPTEATDVKVYVVTEDYAHAEARKSPVVDGKVVRDDKGIEVRFPVILSNYEKDIARAVVAAFDQQVCGFDLLRSNGKSYVCDVNGWSFVKRSVKYYNDAALLLTRLLIRAMLGYDPPVDPTGKISHILHRGEQGDDLNTSMSSMRSACDEFADEPEESSRLSNHESYIELRKKDSNISSLEKSVHTIAHSVEKPAGYHEELRCVIAIFRHGDRTPKQKLKMHVTHPRFLEFFKDVSDPQKEIKLKSAKELGTLLTITREHFDEETKKREENGTDESESERTEHLGKLLQLKTVLEMHGTFRGINRKVQLKPTKWKKVPATMDIRTYYNNRHKKRMMRAEMMENAQRDSSDQERRSSVGDIPLQIASPKSHENPHRSFGATYVDFSSSESGTDDDDVTYDDEGGSVPMKTIVVEAMLILKWGGVLTREGRVHAEAVGKSFRERMYPGVDGFIRLHSTYRHDLKIYSSDEGRVQVTAASFVKGLLDLEGHLTPILTSLVRKNAEVNKLLDDSSLATKSLDFAKERIRSFFYNEADITKDMINEICPPGSPSIVESLESIHNFSKAMNELYTHIRGIVHHLRNILREKRKKALLMSSSAQASATTVAVSPKPQLSSQSSDRSVADNAEQDTSSTVTAVAATMIARAQTPGILFEQKMATGASSEVAQDGAIDTDEGASVIASMGYDLSKRMEDRGDGALTLGDMMLLSYSRWNKLEKDFFKKKNKTFDISKIPDIYDTAKYDVVHNMEMLRICRGHLQKTFYLSQKLANVVVPSEYGIDASQKVEIGSLIAGRLISKIYSDLLESLSPEASHMLQLGTAIPSPQTVPNSNSIFASSSNSSSMVNLSEFSQPSTPTPQPNGISPSPYQAFEELMTQKPVKKLVASRLARTVSSSLDNIATSGGQYSSDEASHKPVTTDENGHSTTIPSSASNLTLSTLPSPSPLTTLDHGMVSIPMQVLKKKEGETIHRLDKKQAKLMGIKSYDRHVRTRLYFTSESHIHALLNCLRFGGKVKNAKGGKPELPTPKWSAMDAIGKVPEINYLSHVVFRLFEVTEYAGGPKVYKARVLVSNGVPVRLDETSDHGHNGLPDVIVGENGHNESNSSSPTKDSSQESSSNEHRHPLNNLPPASELIPLWGEIDLEDLMRLLQSNVPEAVLEKISDNAPKKNADELPPPLSVTTAVSPMVAPAPSPPGASATSNLQQSYTITPLPQQVPNAISTPVKNATASSEA